MLPLDPSLRQANPTFSATKISFDRTVPLDADRSTLVAAVVTEPIGRPDLVRARARALSEAELVEAMG